MAARHANQTLLGEWRTPMPINFIHDDERSVEGQRCYRGEDRDHVRMSVERIHKKIGDEVRVQRFITLRSYAKTEEGVDLEEEEFMMTGRANLRYNRIKWDNGCVWVRADLAAKLYKDKQGKPTVTTNPVPAEGEHSAAPPTDFDTLTAPKAVIQREATHRKAPLDWQTTVAMVAQTLKKEMEEAEARVAKRNMMEAEAPLVLTTPAPQQADEDVEVKGPSRRLIASPGEHGMFCCGSKPQTQEDESLEAEAQAPPPEEVLPEARDMSEGFFSEDQTEDIIDRINDVVGIWGMSEAKEREYIKPPVVAMNKLVKAAMEVFMNNPLMDLIGYLMDEAMEFGVKVQKLGTYINEHFVQPLGAALVDSLTESFQAIEWIKDKVAKVIMMMSQMVTDEVVSKSVTTMADSDLVD